MPLVEKPFFQDLWRSRLFPLTHANWYCVSPLAIENGKRRYLWRSCFEKIYKWLANQRAFFLFIICYVCTKFVWMLDQAQWLTHTKWLIFTKFYLIYRNRRNGLGMHKEQTDKSPFIYIERSIDVCCFYLIIPSVHRIVQVANDSTNLNKNRDCCHVKPFLYFNSAVGFFKNSVLMFLTRGADILEIYAKDHSAVALSKLQICSFTRQLWKHFSKWPPYCIAAYCKTV